MLIIYDEVQRKVFEEMSAIADDRNNGRDWFTGVTVKYNGTQYSGRITIDVSDSKIKVKRDVIDTLSKLVIETNS